MANKDTRHRLLKKEKFLFTPSSSGEVSVVLAYANRYWVAMSNLGFQTVYRLLAQEPRLAVERAYLPDENEGPCRTFESGASLSSAEMIAVSVSFETDYPNVLTILDAAGVDFGQREKTDKDSQQNYRPFILGGGAALTLNPEPLAKFFDAIVIGEGEEVLGEIVRCFLKYRETDMSFEEFLLALAQIDGVYVPSLYSVDYNADNTVSKFVDLSGRSQKVRRRIVENIDLFPTTTVVRTPETEFKAMYMTETGRGCEVGCRFCVAGYMYRPIRKRSESVIADSVQVGLESGAESIGFVGAAVSSHPKIATLARSVAERGKRASLSSIMSQKVTPELAASLSESEYKTVALAPEAGSEELRFRVGKRVCNQQVCDGVRILAREGIRNFKLYFMVGLPSETLFDVEAIPRLVNEVREAALTGAREQADFAIVPRVVLSVNPFIPKAWTPFQRHAFLSSKELKKRLEIVQQGIRTLPNVDMKFESPRESYFQTIMSRGDRRVAELLTWMFYEKKDWRWLVKNGDKEIVPGVPPTDFYVYRTLAEGELLPWEIVDFRLSRLLLEREYLRTFSEDVRPLIARAKRKLEKKLEQVEEVYQEVG